MRHISSRLSINDAKKAVIDRIRKWLKEENMTSSPKADPYADLVLAIEPRKGRIMNVIVGKDKIDSVEIISFVGFSEQDKKAYASLRAKPRNDFVNGIVESLLPINIIYSFRPDLNTLEEIVLKKTIYFDGLTKNSFFDAIHTIVRGIEATHLGYRKLAPDS